MRVKNELFRKACHQLLGEKAVDEDGKDIYTFDNIQGAIPRTWEDQEIKEALVAECKAIDVLNCYLRLVKWKSLSLVDPSCLMP